MLILGFMALILGLVGVAVAVLLLTVEKWLRPLLNGLDAILTAMGFGKWSAGLLTRAEEHFNKKSKV